MLMFNNKNNRIITAPFQQKQTNINLDSINKDNNNLQNQIQDEKITDNDINYLNFQFQSLERIANLEFEKVVNILCRF